MAYDFDQVVDRRGSSSLKWDVKENELPMWVADMDFKASPCIREALEKRLAQGIYGYSIEPEEWAKSYVSWWQRRHGLQMKEEELVFVTGVVPAISSAVRKFTTPGEKVAVMTPVYNIFFNSIVNNGRTPLQCQLDYKDGAYSLNFASLEAVLSDPQVSLLILCNPQNPVGKIWSKEELATIGAMARKHGVLVFSDEIHCDLTDPGKEYVPFALASEENRMNSVTAMAPTKCFNIAGIQTAAVYAANPVLRHKIWRQINTDEVGEGNVFAADAAIAAFNEGEPWLEELRAYIYENKQYVYQFVKEHLPKVHAVPQDCTYLMWLDVRAYIGEGETSKGLAQRIREKTGLYLSNGRQYRGDGDFFLRLNVACPRVTLEDGLLRLKKGLEEEVL
ncbi:MAG: pyridoxal phosphate-dependent aminotransferase [Lachnospiraceae bacterium]|nr:pyridoxal phosphate-dependent aminotransferase [Lachnospiraceae bacterium]